MFGKLPLISCLLVTAKDRFHLAKQSIECYVAQTYPKRELVILNEGPKAYQDQISRYVKSLNRSDIRCVWLDGVGDYTLGGLRNISMALAQGEIFVQWDDDDFCMPQRLSTQYAFMARHPTAKVCYLTDQLHYYFDTSTLYWDSWRKYHSGNGRKKYSLIPGTIMARKDIGVRYPSHGTKCKAGEDTVFAERLLDKHQGNVILMEDTGCMHMYTFHGSNQVYDVEHHSHISLMRSHNKEHMLRHRSRIVDSIQFFKLPLPVKVMARDGLAFVYGGDNV